MRLPRRVPWSSTTELEVVCSWIYTNENDLESKQLAVHRMSAWKAITPLPHALESTLSILVVILQDSTHQPQTSHLSLRQSYASAIIRLVNGLVDPLQLGAYARSIASIANQLGLPPWLVELRHAATHEDLPSIELLREAARESMTWLLHNYFLPTINPSSVARSQTTPLRSLAPILKQYKNLLKITTRDASLKSQYKSAIAAIMRDVERWISEAKVAANVITGEIGWESGLPENLLDSGEIDIKERWALEKLCDSLLDKGALVPLSKKKRGLSTDPFSPPEFSVLLWHPLLQHLHSTHPDFLVVLAARIVSTLLPEDGSLNVPVENQTDVSYDMCLARWAMWSIETWERGDPRGNFNLKKEITTSLLHAISHSISETSRVGEGALALLQCLCSGNDELEVVYATLLQLSTHTSSGKWDPNGIAVMDQRLNTLLALNKPADTLKPHSPLINVVTTEADGPIPISISEWRVLDEKSGWRPCPIGIYCPTT